MKKYLLLLFAICLFLCSTAQSPRILVPFRAGKRWGYSDTLGNVKIPLVYDSVSLFDYGWQKKGDVIATVIRHGTQMVLNDKGLLLVPAGYDQFDLLREMEDFAFWVSKKGKKTVLMKGRQLFPLVYDELFLLPGNYFQVKKDDKWGVIDRQGKVVVPVVYDGVMEESSQSGVLTIRTFGGTGSKTYSLKMEPASFDSAPLPLIDMLETVGAGEMEKDSMNALVHKYQLDSVRGTNSAALIVYKNGKPGLLLPEENKLYFFSKPYRIHQVRYFSGSQQTVWNKGVFCIIASINGKYGILNESEYQVLPFAYDSIEEKDDFFLLKQSGKMGFFIWNTPYRPIRPAYDWFIRKHLVPVNSNWVFTLFEVMKNGKRGFVGENGVAFFKE